jgi:hypothetical protein
MKGLQEPLVTQQTLPLSQQMLPLFQRRNDGELLVTQQNATAGISKTAIARLAAEQTGYNNEGDANVLRCVNKRYRYFR